MTDRHTGYIVTLSEEIREDDAEAILNALRMVKHVISVDPIVADGSDFTSTVRANRKWQDKIFALVDDMR